MSIFDELLRVQGQNRSNLTSPQRSVLDGQILDTLLSQQGRVSPITNPAFTVPTQTVDAVNAKTVKDVVAGLIDAEPVSVAKTVTNGLTSGAMTAEAQSVSQSPTFLDNLLRVGRGMGTSAGRGKSFVEQFNEASLVDSARTAAAQEAQAERAILEADLAAKRAASKQKYELDLRRVVTGEKGVEDAQDRFIYSVLPKAQQESQNEIVRDLLERHKDLKAKVQTGKIGIGKQEITSVAKVYTQLEKESAGKKLPDQLIREAVAIVTSSKTAADPVVGTGPTSLKGVPIIPYTAVLDGG